MTDQCTPPPRPRPMRSCPKYGLNMTLPMLDTSQRKRRSTTSLPLNLYVFFSANVLIMDKTCTQCAYRGCVFFFFFFFLYLVYCARGLRPMVHSTCGQGCKEERQLERSIKSTPTGKATRAVQCHTPPLTRQRSTERAGVSATVLERAPLLHPE